MLRIVAVLARALVWSTLFVGFVLMFLPARVLSAAGVTSPGRWGAAQLAGLVLGTAGSALAAWCILGFVVFGRGTPAPFDPPRQLVVRGPYRFVRNPMYLGAGLALAGAALFYESGALGAYAVGFLLVMHLFVVLHEEPTLRRTFGDAYAAYCTRIHRWLPRISA